MQKLLNNIKSSLAIQVLIGFSLGILTGIFFGEMTSSLAFIGTAYIRLFQMPVIPYIIVSLISGLGKLDFKTAKSLFINAGLVLLGLWLIILIVVMLFPLGFPNWESASFFTESLIEPPKNINFVELFLPSNPFSAMANTVIPSVVTFSVAVGLAFIAIPKKQGVIELLEKLGESLIVITRFVAKLSPIGVFAIVANAAGTLQLDDFGRLQIHIILHGLVSLALTFGLLPAIISICTPIKYGDIIRSVKAPLATVFATSNLLVALPILVESSKKLIDDIKPPESKLTGENEDSPIDVLIPASFNFPNMGKLMSMAFVLFAGWYVGTPVSPTQYPTFVPLGVAVLFADGTLAMTFLLSLLKIPLNMLNIFITVEVFTGRFGNLVAAMHTVTLAILGTCAMQGLISIRKKKLIRLAIVSVLVGGLIFGSVHFIFSYIFPQQYRKSQILTNLELFRVRNAQPAQVYDTPPPPRIIQANNNIENAVENENLSDTSNTNEITNRLDLIKQTKTIRVCYTKNDYPLSYINEQGNLVGMDVEKTHIFTRDLGVNLEFVPVQKDLYDFSNFGSLLNQGYCDMAIPVFPLNPQGENLIDFAQSHATRTIGFLVRNSDKEQFNFWRSLQGKEKLKIAIPANIPYYSAKVKGLLPNAEISFVKSTIQEFLEKDFSNYDALALSAEVASSWSLLYPQNTVAVPQPIVKFPVAYLLPEDSRQLADVVNVWLELKQQDGTIQSLYDYWIRGNLGATKEPRWSVIRNVLGWVE